MTLASDALGIARAGVRAADPAAAVRRLVTARRDGLRVGDALLPVPVGGRVHLLAIGKAAAAMADAAARIAGPEALGLVVTPAGSPVPRSSLPVRFGEHPVPGAGSLRAGAALLRHARETDERDAVLFLISGGGSAVAELPLEPLTIGDVARTTRVLLASGAAIGEMNAIRRHLSAVKGGRLAAATTAGRHATVAISDVVGDAPENIASGPTVADPSTFARAATVVRSYRLRRALPPRVVRWLDDGRRGDHAETPKWGDPAFRGATFHLAATNRTSVDAAVSEARSRGYRTRLVAAPVVGETQTAARRFARHLVGLAAGGTPSALIGGGETTVTLGRRPGRGGRNQEFALAVASELAGHARTLVLSLGTDGIDGPTDAAGGWVDDGTMERARRRRVDLDAACRRHAAYAALRAVGGLVRTGPTGTNVMDLHVGLVAPPRASRRGRK
jgi:glycerate 2-kinase